MEKSFEDLLFRGTKWYLAKDVDKKLDAIKEWYLENGPFHCDIHDLIELGKILEIDN